MAVVSEPEILEPGREIAPGYEAVAHLSRGHRLDVYDAWSDTHHARCVVKVVRPDRASEHDPCEQLRTEGRLLRDLAHPHLVRAYSVLEHPRVAVVMETLTGETIENMVDRRGRLAPTDVAMLGAQVASALLYLHRHRWIHADLTSGNVLNEGGRAKVIDLSLVSQPGPTYEGSGTTGFRSPEQEAGGWLSYSADVWGLGAVLHDALYGAPLDEPRPKHRRWQIGRRNQEAYRQVVRVIDGCLVPEPHARWALADVAARLALVAPLR